MLFLFLLAGSERNTYFDLSDHFHTMSLLKFNIYYFIKASGRWIIKLLSLCRVLRYVIFSLFLLRFNFTQGKFICTTIHTQGNSVCFTKEKSINAQFKKARIKPCKRQENVFSADLNMVTVWADLRRSGSVFLRWGASWLKADISTVVLITSPLLQYRSINHRVDTRSLSMYRWYYSRICQWYVHSNQKLFKSR